MSKVDITTELRKAAALIQDAGKTIFGAAGSAVQSMETAAKLLYEAADRIETGGGEVIAPLNVEITLWDLELYRVAYALQKTQRRMHRIEFPAAPDAWDDTLDDVFFNAYTDLLGVASRAASITLRLDQWIAVMWGIDQWVAFQGNVDQDTLSALGKIRSATGLRDSISTGPDFSSEGVKRVD